MPNFLAVGGVGVALRPRDLLRRFHVPHYYDGPHHQHGDVTVGGHHAWCLPHKRGAKQQDGRHAVKKLAEHLEELSLMREKMSVSLTMDACENTDGYSSAAAAGRCTPDGKQRQTDEVSQDVHKQLTTILNMIRDLSGDGTDMAPRKSGPQEDVVELLEQLIDADVPVQLLSHLDILEFEARNDVMNMCCALLRPGLPQHFDKQVVEYLQHHPRVLKVLVDGYSNEQTALHYGVVIRSCARHSELAEAFLTSGLVFELVRYAKHTSIDISSDAFYTLREMLLAHKNVSAEWLEDNFEAFFALYNKLLMSGEYIAQRQAQKLLIEILLDRHFRKVMLAYVSCEQHLQIHMNLLKDRSKVIQFQAFHAFKVFVANPTKPVRIQKILYRNRDKLVTLLESLRAARPEDTKLGDESRTIIDKLLRMSAPNSPVQHHHEQN